MTMKLYSFKFKAMGSPCEIKLYAASKQKAKALSHTAHKEILRLEDKYSRYKHDSFLSRINRTAESAGSINVDKETLLILNYADVCYQQSDGLFDITSGVLRKVWKQNLTSVPSRESLNGVLERIGWDNITINRDRLSFAVPGIELDFGGVVKEYAVDCAAGICARGGISGGYIDLGGDIRVIGPHPDGTPWRVGIQHPFLADQVMSRFEVYRGAVASSGDYERFVMIDGERYSHILSPKTGWPVKELAAVSVVAANCMVAGSASTIAMLKESQGPDYLDELGLSHIWMKSDRTIGGSLLPDESTDQHVREMAV